MFKLLRVWVGQPGHPLLHITIIIVIIMALRITTSQTEGYTCRGGEGVEGVRKCAHLSPIKCPNHGKHTVTYLFFKQLQNTGMYNSTTASAKLITFQK